jgi:hypothetical protein
MRKTFLFSLFFFGLTACANGTTTIPTETDTSSGNSHTIPDAPPAASGSSGGAVPDSTGPITIKNLSFSQAGSSSSTGLELTFTIANQGAATIYKIQEITVAVDGGSPVTYAANCSPYDWMVSPGSTSGVISVTLSTYSTQSSLYISGGSCSSIASNTAMKISAPSSLRLDITGLFDDAAQWKAHATASK